MLLGGYDKHLWKVVFCFLDGYIAEILSKKFPFAYNNSDNYCKISSVISRVNLQHKWIFKASSG